MDKCKTPIVIFLDFSKAFDSLNHKILLTKLSSYGVTPLALKLVEKLSNRQKTICSHTKPDPFEFHFFF